MEGPELGMEGGVGRVSGFNLNGHGTMLVSPR